MKTELRRNSKASKHFTIFDISKKTHRDKILAEHKSITSLEPPENDLLRVFKTHSIGFGVIAHKTIKKNETICTYQGKTVVQEIKNGVIPKYDEVVTALATKKKQLTQSENKPLTDTAQEEFDEDAHRLKKLIKSYAFVLKQNNKQCMTVLSHRQAGIAALVNCSWNGFANVEAILIDNQIVYRAIRDILPGEEILIDYGCDYIDSQEFLHIFPIGSRSIDLFLKQNAEHYPSPHQSITLDKTEQALLGTQATHVLVPHYCSDHKKLKSLSDTEINLLPVIEMVKSTTSDQLIPLPSQQFMTGLMYACLKPELREHQALFDKLIQKEMCVDFVTTNGRSAWHILTARYDNTRHINKMCMKLSTALYHLYDKRGWTNAYLPYLRKNLKETSLENQEAIFSASLIPPKKTHSKRINLTQEDSQPKTNPSVVAETLITTEASPFDKSLILSEAKLDDLLVSHSLSSIQHKDSYHSTDEKMIVEARPEVISPQFSNEEKIQPEVTPYFTDDEKMREPSETKQAGFNAHMELDPGIEPPSELKRSDSIPMLEAVSPTENKSIILPIIKPREYIALTIESKIEPKIEPKEEAKQSDISMIWWDAAVLAAHNNDSALNKLISAKENLIAINWNYTPLAGCNRGITLALLAAVLCGNQKPDLLEILLGLPVETYHSLDWNAYAVDESHPERGITLAWLAAINVKKPDLLKILAESPSSIHCSLNWHAAPQALNHINRGITLAWLIVKLNYSGSSFGLMLPLARLSQTLTDINWNVGPLDPKNNCYGESLAYLIVQSFWQMHEEAHLMIQALITSSQHTRHEINWNASGQTKFTLAYHAIRMAMGHHNYRYLHLLNALLDSPITVFMQLDWNMGISPDCSLKASNPTIAAYAVSLALEGDSRLLEKLLALPQSIFDKLDWNSGAEPLATNAMRLGLKGDTQLLQKLLDSPVEILTTIEWNKNNLLAIILRATPKFFHPAWIKKLIRPELLVSLPIWNDPLKSEFKKLVDKGLPECDEALAKLPAPCLRILCENFFADELSQVGISYGYIKFLIAMKSNHFDKTALSSLSHLTQYHPSRLANAYFGLAQTEIHFDLRNHYYSQVGKDSPFYAEAQKKLRESSPPQPILIAPSFKLKRNDSMPIPAILLSENKYGNKRKSRDCIDLTIEPVVKKLTSESTGSDEKKIKNPLENENLLTNKTELKLGAIPMDVRGLNCLAIAVKFQKTNNLKAICQHPNINQGQIMTLISTPQMEGREAGLTALDIAVKYYCEPIFVFLFNEVIRANRLDLIQKPQLTGEYRGCSLLAIAILKRSLCAVKILEEIKGIDQRIALITASQAPGLYSGMTALVLAVRQDEMKILNFLLDIAGPKKFSLLTHYNTVGFDKGHTVVSYASIEGCTSFFSLLLDVIGKEDLFKLINLPLVTGKFKEQTPFELAFYSSGYSAEPAVLTLLTSIIPPAKKFEMFNTFQLGGTQAGCTNFAVAVHSHYFYIIKEILNNNNTEQNIALITTPQKGPFLEGLTPISFVIRMVIEAIMRKRKGGRVMIDPTESFNIIRLLLTHLPLSSRLSVLNYQALKGNEKGLSAFNIAAKYCKPDGEALLMEQIRPLLTAPKTVSIVANQSVSFNFSSQVSMSADTVTTSTSACLSVTQTTVEKTL